jgi:transposase-like protein
VTRNERIVAGYAEPGASYESVGRSFGLTRERVRQVIKAMGGKAKERKAPVRDAVLRLNVLGMMNKDIAAALGCSCATVRDALCKAGRRSVVPPLKHGTRNAYGYHRCRCEPCVLANRMGSAEGNKRAYAKRRRLKVCSYCMSEMAEGRVLCQRHILLHRLYSRRYRLRLKEAATLKN